IVIDEVVDSPTLNEDGEVIFKMIKKALEKGEKVEVSFENIYALNSSFINSAFIELLEYFPFETIRNNLHFLKSTKNINKTILKRFSEEVKNKSKFIGV